MFRDALLESSPALRRRNGWPMATAFTLQMIVASVLVLVPLISTGVLPIATETVVPMPPRYTPMEMQHPQTASGSRVNVSVPTQSVVQLTNTHPLLPSPFTNAAATDTSDQPLAPQLNVGGSSHGLDIPLAGQPIPPVQPKRIIISRYEDAMLLNKVIPVYPAIARIAGVQGDVLLHAIISKDGTIESLTVTSGPAMLRQSALQAVQQWRYKPYLLNGQAVEVETVITVSFKRS